MHADCPTTRSQWAWMTTTAVIPALCAALGYAVVFHGDLPRASAAVVMGWSLVLTFVASQRTALLMRAALEARPPSRTVVED